MSTITRAQLLRRGAGLAAVLLLPDGRWLEARRPSADTIELSAPGAQYFKAGDVIDWQGGEIMRVVAVRGNTLTIARNADVI